VAQLNGKNYLYTRPPGSQGTDWIYGDVQPDRLQDFKITNMTYNEIAIGWGYQRIIKQRFSLSMDLGFLARRYYMRIYFDSYYNGLYEKCYIDMFTEVKNTSGASVWGMIDNESLFTDTVSEGKQISRPPESWGFHASLRFGYLLF